MEIYHQWLESCRQCGIPAISTDTAARLMSVLLENGNNEAMTHDNKFLADVEYIQKRFHIEGGETPDKEFQILLKKYVKELKDFYEANKHLRFSKEKGLKAVVPEWAVKLFKDRYNMSLI